MNIDLKTRRPVRWDDRLKEWRYADVDGRIPQRYRSPLDGVTEAWETPEECAAADAMRLRTRKNGGSA